MQVAATELCPDETSGTMLMPLSVKNVAKRFQQGNVAIPALRGVALSVARGEFVAVMGASGSGKSTLLHLMAGLTRPDEGRILVDGQDLAAMGDRQLTLFRRRRIGLVFQAFNLIPALTAEQNILLPTQAGGGMRPEPDRLDELLKRLGLLDRRHHRPDALSGGEQQRVAIARALIANPAIILADEPTGSVDSITGQGICRLLKQLCEEQGRTIVIVTHEPAVAIWARRVVILQDGRNLGEFSTSELGDAQSLAARYLDAVRAASPAEQHS
ncbi:MAG: ABC transporter ATP-binding protein [Bacillota bacterium]